MESYINEKRSKEYMFQIRNNFSEKTAEIINLIRHKYLPRNKNGEMVIVEFGVGGGESLSEIMHHINMDEVRLIGMDLFPEVLTLAKEKNPDTDFVAADMGHIPLKSNSVSGINASSIFHEVSSYGVKIEGVRKYGREAIKKVFSEVNRSLLNGGCLTYRDVSAPIGDGTEIRKVNYQGDSWKEFFMWFESDFIKNLRVNYYREEQVIYNEVDDNCISVEMSRNLHRETQRHYLMFRDHVINNMTDITGINVVKSEWVDHTSGKKDFFITIYDCTKAYCEKFRDRYNGNEIKLSSDDFDALIDDVIKYWLTELNKNRLEVIKFTDSANRWKNREASESYVYGDYIELLKMSAETSLESDDEMVLFPKAPSDIMRIQRDYYNRYLKSRIDHPEQDAKQIINFYKISKQDALAVANILLQDSRFDECKDRIQVIFDLLGRGMKT